MSSSERDTGSSGQASVKKVLTVATLLCVVCSVLVSTAAVVLGPMQEENRKLDVQKKLLLIAGLLDDERASKEEVRKAFEQVEAKVFDLATGEEAGDIDPDTFNQRKASKDPRYNKMIDPKIDKAKIRFRSRYSKVYFVKRDGAVEKIVLPIYGKGLWSTLYGFIALAPDMNTVKGFGYYEHGETPGLGGEVDNPAWRAGWQGKKLYSQGFAAGVKANQLPLESGVDALAGATITTNGVEYMVHYWMGPDGYAKVGLKLLGGQ